MTLDQKGKEGFLLLILRMDQLIHNVLVTCAACKQARPRESLDLKERGEMGPVRYHYARIKRQFLLDSLFPLMFLLHVNAKSVSPVADCGEHSSNIREALWLGSSPNYNRA